MKKNLLLAALLMIGIVLAAQTQTQQGFVKTRGRMVDGQHIPGQGLKGATVSIHGRTTVLVDTDNGSFSFPVTETQFRLDSVRKKGYQLVDIDACPRTYKFSANPLYIVMETPEQQLQDQLRIEKDLRRTLRIQLEQRENEIEALKAQQLITEDDYRKALQKLYADTDQNARLVRDMVECYSKIDFDQLDEFNQKISELILDGELTKADSLVRTKGDIDERVLLYHQQKTLNSLERDNLTQRQELLEQSEALALKVRDDLAQDCYQEFEIFKMLHENDSAVHYLELRTSLDTTNWDWLNSTGLFYYDYLADYDKVSYYYNKCLSLAIILEDTSKVAFSYNNLGSLYQTLGNYDKAIEHYQKAIDVLTTLNGEHNNAVALNYNNIGLTYSIQGNYEKALEYYEKALLIRESSSLNRPDYIASTYNNIGSICFHQGNNEAALLYLTKALETLQSYYGDNHPDVARMYNNIGRIYDELNNYELALEYYNKALNIWLLLFGENHPDISIAYNNIGGTFHSMGNTEESIEYFEKSLSIKKQFYGENHPDIAIIYNNLGHVFMSQGDYQNALEYHNNALAIKIAYFGEQNLSTALSYNNIGSVYYKLEDYETALEYFGKALSIRVQILDENHNDIATSYYNIGSSYCCLNRFDIGLEYLNKALSIREKIFGFEDSRTIKIQQKIAEIQAKMNEQENTSNE